MAKKRTPGNGQRHPKEPGGSPHALIKSITALVGALFGGAAGALTLGPPTDVPALTTALTTAVAAITWLLAWSFGRWVVRGRRPHKARVWIVIAVAGVSLLLAVLWYVDVHDARTVPYAGERRIIGTELTEQGRKFAAETGYGPRDLLMAAAGNAEHVWTTASLRSSARLLWSTFMLVVGACLFPVLFLWYVVPMKAIAEDADASE